MAVKFNRTYQLTLDTVDGRSVRVEYPLTLQFQVNRNNLASACTASFTIYNLSPQTRSILVKDRLDTTNFKSVRFAAGYDDFLPVVFEGEIRSMQSFRRGPDYLTQVECWSGGYDMANAKTSLTVPAGTTVEALVRRLAADFKQVKKVVVGRKFGVDSKRATSISGNTVAAIKELVGYRFYIDNQVAYALDNNEVVAGELQVIDDNSGILETPRRQDKVVDVGILFEPRLRVGQRVELVSRSGLAPDASGNLVGTPSPWNGAYKVIGINHSGIISASENGPCTTTVSMIRPDGALTLVSGL